MSERTPQEIMTDFLNQHQPRPEALAQAIITWIHHGDAGDPIPVPAPDQWNRAAVALFAELARYLHEEAPEALGWAGLRNRELADAMLAGMGAPDAAAPPGTKGVVALKAFARDGLVALQYTEDLVVGLPVATARQLGEAVLAIAGEIDGRQAMVVYAGPLRKGEGQS